MSRPATARIALAALTLALALSATPASAATPLITHTTVSGVTETSATLEAKILPTKKTSYHFEFGPADCSLLPSPCENTPTPAKIEGEAAISVSAVLEGLTPGATYHFRIVADNNDGHAAGPDRLFATYAPPQPSGPCANDALRLGRPSALLPDCRAYEQASPVDKNGVDARARVSFAKASEAGDRISFSPAGGIPGAEGSQEMPVYLASRAAGGWSTQGLLPPATTGEEAFVLGWTTDFSQVFDSARRYSGLGGTTFLTRSSEGGALATIVPYGGGLHPEPRYAGASAEGSKVLFESPAKLASVPAAIEGKPNLYLWDRDTGAVRLAGAFNDNTAPPAGAFSGAYDWIGQPGPEQLERGGAAVKSYSQDQHVISADGSEVYFTAAKTGQVYLRVNPGKEQSPLDGEGKCVDPALACTLHVSASEKKNGTGTGGADPAGTRPAAFMGATPDGDSAFFTSSEKLTNDANTGPELLPAAIARANIADGGAKNLSFLPAKARGIALDAAHVYWADPAAGAIGRADLDGGDPKPEFITGLGHPQYVAVDAGHVYWTDAGDGADGQGAIGRADINGTPASVEPALITGASNPQGIDVDSEHIYWSNAGGKLETRTVGRSDLFGTPGSVDQAFVQVDAPFQETTPQGLAVDATHIYLAVTGSSENTFVVRFDIGGEKASEKFVYSGLGAEPRGLALDAGHVYWSIQETNAIGRAKLDLSEPQLEFVKGADHPLGLAADAAHLYWSANQDTPPNPGADLYRYDYDPATGEGSLSDLAVGAAGNGAQVVGVLGASADGASVYFAANGDLDGAGPAQAGDCGGGASQNSLSYHGHCNLYLAREGSPVAFVAPLDAGGGGSDAADWLPRGLDGQLQKTSRVSADGTLLFRSQERLSDYENEGTPELYRYRAGEGLDCVSCDPSGEAPTGTPGLGSISLSFLVPPDLSYVLSRNISADGDRVFFETTDALVRDDVNGEAGCPLVGPSQGRYRSCLDVYEWEAEGAGGCESESQGGGCIYLLSSGKSDDASYFADASASGNDAFLITRSPLVGQDLDQLYDVYDARLGGGLASQSPPPPTICEAEACKGAPSAPPASPSAGSAAFSGAVNPPPRRPGCRRKHHRGCGKHHQPKHKKQHRRHRGG